MCTLTAFGLQPMHYLYALWKMCLTNLSLSCSSCVSLLSLSRSLSHSAQAWWCGRWTSQCRGPRWRSCSDWRTTGASVWPGAQLAPPRAAAPTFALHVSIKAACLHMLHVCVWETEWESKRKRNSERANVFNFLLVTRVSLSIYANKLP